MNAAQTMRADFVECLGTADVTVVDDDVRAALDALRHAVDMPRAVIALQRAVREAPTVEIAECPGRMLLIESGVWHGQVTETRRCDVCGRQVSS